jgi:hypothetical protein
MARLDEFDIIVRRKDTSTIAIVPQLGLYAKGADIVSALELLEQRKKILREDLEAGVIDEADLIAEPVGVQSRATRSGTIGQFTIKAVILIALLILTGWVASEVVSTKIGDVIDKSRFALQETKIGGAQFWTKVESDLERAASPSSDLSEEKKRKLLSSIRAIVDRWRPFVTEATLIFSPEPKDRRENP